MLDVNTRHQLLYNDPHLELFMGATGAGHCFGEDFFLGISQYSLLAC